MTFLLLTIKLEMLGFNQIRKLLVFFFLTKVVGPHTPPFVATHINAGRPGFMRGRFSYSYGMHGQWVLSKCQYM
jgi:hypothetical protein